MNRMVLLLGSNLENRIELLDNARSLIGSEIGKIITISSVYETAPWGFESSNPFLNQAVLIDTVLLPEIILEKCLSIEKQLGRVRNDNFNYSDRSIDIDILLYENWIVSNPDLEIPHPRMHKRKFCMEPLLEIVPDWIIPTFQLTVKEIHNRCEDNSKINKIDAKV